MKDNLEQQIEDEEGRVAYAYQDSEGFWTIGVGCMVDHRKGGGLRPDEIDYILKNRIAEARVGILSLVPWVIDLDVCRQDALINMAFQLGPAGVSKFGAMLMALHVHDWQKSHDEALDSLWAKQTPARAKRIAMQLLTGEYQWKQKS